MKRILTACFIIFLTASNYSIAAEGKDLAAISTKAGNLRLVEREQNRFFMLNKEEIYKGTDFLVIKRFFRPRNSYDGLLIKDYDGPIACPVLFRFITIKKDKSWSVTEPFGHCADKPKLSMKGDLITIKFKAFGSRPAATWTYNGKDLKQIK